MTQCVVASAWHHPSSCKPSTSRWQQGLKGRHLDAQLYESYVYFLKESFIFSYEIKNLKRRTDQFPAYHTDKRGSNPKLATRTCISHSYTVMLQKTRSTRRSVVEVLTLPQQYSPVYVRKIVCFLRQIIFDLKFIEYIKTQIGHFLLICVELVRFYLRILIYMNVNLSFQICPFYLIQENK